MLSIIRGTRPECISGYQSEATLARDSRTFCCVFATHRLSSRGRSSHRRFRDGNSLYVRLYLNAVLNRAGGYLRERSRDTTCEPYGYVRWVNFD